MSQIRSIKQLPQNKRPREKLSQTGVKNLTEDELLALILGSGSRKRNVLGLAKQISKIFHQKETQLEQKDLMALHGVGPVKTAQILALIEFGRRNFTPHQGTRILQPKDILPEVKKIRDSRREQLIGLYLNAHHELQAKETLAVGSLNKQQLVLRDIFAQAITLPSRCLLLVHNHPSGNLQPSQDDLMTTEKIKKACQLLGVELLDHLIVTKNNYLSFKEKGLL